ncbi:DUF2690 domain-containing protein [Streptomyces sp. NPDC006283]|uniref:DUF2690 domain-containing protein n=1 Tax=Streptomyces sp. NPDC006283 TaxID=3156741 RepID=UPI0033A90501
MKRFIAVGLGVMVAAAGTAFAPAAQAAPTAGCHGSGCRGLDPNQAGCSADAYTVARVNTLAGTVQLRYSPSCRSNWARIERPAPASVLSVKECGPSGYNVRFRVPSGYTVAWTYMVDGTGPAKAGDGATYTPCR